MIFLNRYNIMYKTIWNWILEEPKPVFLNRNRFQGMNSAGLCSLAGRYDNPIPTQFLVPKDSLKIPAQYTFIFSTHMLHQGFAKHRSRYRYLVLSNPGMVFVSNPVSSALHILDTNVKNCAYALDINNNLMYRQFRKSNLYIFIIMFGRWGRKVNV